MTPRFFRLAAAAGTIAALAASHASAQALTVEQARAIVAPFYDALNAAPGRDAAALVLAATTADWVSCGNNDQCSPREKVAPAIAGFSRAIPDLKWEIKEILVAGDRIVVRGEASGTPAGPFMGVPHGGRSFRVMSIDIHTVRDGKLTRAHHIEDWMGAARQLSAK
ncbi:MAG: ester cyclase [Burkholderiales bacterium]|nr:ester cyclase [Burkholderiales bacterium]